MDRKQRAEMCLKYLRMIADAGGARELYQKLSVMPKKYVPTGQRFIEETIEHFEDKIVDGIVFSIPLAEDIRGPLEEMLREELQKGNLTLEDIDTSEVELDHLTYNEED